MSMAHNTPLENMEMTLVKADAGNHGGCLETVYNWPYSSLNGHSGALAQSVTEWQHLGDQGHAPCTGSTIELALVAGM